MTVAIIGITKQKQTGKSKKTDKPYSGYFVTFGYKRDTVNGYETKTMLYTEDMEKKNMGYIPSPGDECEISLGWNGFVEHLAPVVENSK